MLSYWSYIRIGAEVEQQTRWNVIVFFHILITCQLTILNSLFYFIVIRIHCLLIKNRLLFLLKLKSIEGLGGSWKDSASLHSYVWWIIANLRLKDDRIVKENTLLANRNTKVKLEEGYITEVYKAITQVKRLHSMKNKNRTVLIPCITRRK